MDSRQHLPDTTPTHPPSLQSTDLPVAEALGATLAYARERDYRGWDFGDGMSSRILQALPVESKWLNIAFQETVKRAPLNVRPLLLVEQRRNYQGTALFAMSNQNAHWVHERLPGALTAPPDGFDAETESLLDWLVAHRREGYSGFCGGHQHPIQHLDGGVGRPDQPDVVSTSYAVRALLRGKYLDQEYATTASTAPRFVLSDLDYREVDDGAVINYHMNHDPDVFTVNAGALGARLLVDVYDHTGEEAFLEAARAILDHVAGLQTTRGGWYYRDPPESSHLSMDSHHNGFVIEAFQRYDQIVGDGRYEATLADALNFYERVLFEPDGAPNFDEESAYPRDVHASAQGILVFTYAGDFTLARKLVEWTLDNLYLGDGRFIYRRYRLHDKRHVLMRWCVGWMAYALSEYLRCRYVDSPVPG
jgi:hypothetical protein